MTFDEWWATYDPDDSHTAADKGMARYAWDCAVAAERERAAAVVEQTPPAGGWLYSDEQGSYWESDAEKTLAEAARRVREGR